MFGTLYFEDNYGLLHKLEENEYNKINFIKHLEDLGYKASDIYYFRTWEQDNIITIDFGSHSCFFKFYKNVGN